MLGLLQHENLLRACDCQHAVIADLTLSCKGRKFRVASESAQLLLSKLGCTHLSRNLREPDTLPEVTEGDI